MDKQKKLLCKQRKKEKRKEQKHAMGLSILFGILSIVCIILVVVSGMFDQTFYILTGSKFAKVSNTSDDAMYYTSDYDSEEERLAAGDALTQQLEAEGAVLLKNENDALPLEAGSKLSCFSQSSVRLVYGGTGSGSVDTSKAANLKDALTEEGFEVNPTLWDFYDTGDGAGYKRGTRSIRGSGEWSINEVPWDKYTDEVKDSVASYGDAALVVISRSGGEGTDLPINDCEDGEKGNYLTLNADEKEMLSQLADMKEKGEIQKIVLLINSSNTIQVDFLTNDTYDIDAALWIGGVGQSGIQSVAGILSGKINPSGRLVDTYCNDNLSSPAMQNFGAFTYTNADQTEVNGESKMSDYYVVYQEGIYIGYRYYETRYEDAVMQTGNTEGYDYHADVAYPFGYGLSYTTYTEDLQDITYDEKDDTFHVTVKVTNTGEVAGKHTVELYQQRPYTDYDRANGIEQASVNLCGFAKTETLEPGASETLEITVEKREWASYDANGNGSYILEAGDYYFALGENAHDAVNNILAKKGFDPQNTNGLMDAAGDEDKVFVFTQSETDADTYSKTADGTEIQNQFANADLNTYDDGQQSVTYLSRSDWAETFPKQAVSLAITDTMKEDLADCVYLDSGKNADAMGQVAEELPTMGADNGLSLVDMMGKDFDDSDWNLLLDQMTFEEMADLVGNAFHLTKAVESVNLPDTRDENGPQGLTARLMKGNVSSTSFTSEDVMAATWNRDLIEEVGKIIGEDCLANGYSGLYGMGNNIHRTPYSGRNFEYYSEDGFISGKMASAETKGIQSKGTYVFMKHAALNDSETNRSGLSTFANEQSIREIYLKAFQYAMEDNETAGVMTSMNRIGCTWASADAGLLRGVFRGEWNNKGMYISDNTTMHTYTSGIDGVLGGNTLFDAMSGKQHKQFLSNGKEDATVVQALREACHYNLYVLANSNAMNGLTTDSVVKISRPAWWIGLRVITVVFIGLFAWQVGALVIRTRKFNMTHPKIK